MKDMNSIQNTLFSTISSQQPELNQLLQQLIRIRSYTGEEQEIVEFIIEKMKEYGFDEAYSDGLGNAVGRIGNGPVKILFDAHVDTVKVTESEEWQYPPFDGKIVNDKIYGRGAVDEKPAVAGYLIAGKVIKQHFGNETLPFTLYVVGSVLEEDYDGYPLWHLVKNEGIKPGFVLLGEPSGLQVCRGQRGRMELKIETFGRAAHGAHNKLGINAVYKIAPIITGIEKLDNQLPGKEPLGKGSITVSQVTSRAPSLCSVPDYAQIHIDRRLTVNEDQKGVIEELEKIVKNTGVDAKISTPKYSGVSWKGIKFEQEAYFPTWIFEEDHPLVQAGLKTAEKVLEKPAKSRVWAFSTNGVATAGHLGIPTVGFGPGREELSHTTREELALDDLLKATQFYALFPFQLTSASG
ncbi:MAG: YgeY family selenium metabolism-linked hydrolase, partial [Candidatus Aminicenantes bacterium]